MMILTFASGMHLPFAAAAQASETSGPPVDVSDLVELLTGEEAVEELDGALVGEILDEPVDVNRAGIDVLAEVPGLSLPLARKLVAARDRHGPFGSLDAMVAVGAVPAHVLDQIRPFVAVVPRDPPDERQHPARRRSRDRASSGQLVTQVALRRERGGFLGLPASTSHFQSESRWRLRLAPGPNFNLRVSATSRGSLGPPGDPAGGLQIGGDSRVLGLTIGDFHLKAGAGLVLGRPLLGGAAYAAFGPAPSASSVRLDATTSTRTSLRGLAISLQPSEHIRVLVAQGWRTGAYASRRDHSSTVQDSAQNDDQTERSSLDSGESTLAFAGTVGAGSISVGLAGHTTSFDPPVLPDEQLYLRHAFSGPKLSSAGIFAAVITGPAHGFVELARSSTRATAGVAGLQISDSDGLTARLQYRRYPKHFPFHLGRPLRTTSSEGTGEHGWLVSVRARPRKGWSISGFADMFRHEWVRRGFGRPVRGFELTAEVAGPLAPDASASLRISERQREIAMYTAEASGRETRAVEEQVRRSFRVQIDTRLNRRISVRTRVEGAVVRSPLTRPHRSVLFYQQVRWFASRGVLVEARMAQFDAADYHARLYMHEGDVLFHSTLSALYGEGQRSYVRTRLNLSTRMSVEAKVGAFRYLRSCLENNGVCERTSRIDGRFQARLML